MQEMNENGDLEDNMECKGGTRKKGWQKRHIKKDSWDNRRVRKIVWSNSIVGNKHRVASKMKMNIRV